jgi:hypothetical protein
MKSSNHDLATDYKTLKYFNLANRLLAFSAFVCSIWGYPIYVELGGSPILYGSAIFFSVLGYLYEEIDYQNILNVSFKNKKPILWVSKRILNLVTAAIGCFVFPAIFMYYSVSSEVSFLAEYPLYIFILLFVSLLGDNGQKMASTRQVLDQKYRLFRVKHEELQVTLNKAIEHSGLIKELYFDTKEGKALLSEHDNLVADALQYGCKLPGLI